MQTLKQKLSNLGLRMLEKSRAYYYPPSYRSDMAEEDLSDEEYAVLLAEIDRFSAELLAREVKENQAA